MMKVYLDDERQTPDGWVRAYWPDEVIELLKTGDVQEVSLDHDLGDDKRGTGYDVLLWIEAEVFCGRMEPPVMRVHSANSSARERMLAAIDSIHRLAREPAIIEVDLCPATTAQTLTAFLASRCME